MSGNLNALALFLNETMNLFDKLIVIPVQLTGDRDYTYPLMLHGELISEAYAVVGLPTSYVVSTDGRIVYSGFGTSTAIEVE